MKGHQKDKIGSLKYNINNSFVLVCIYKLILINIIITQQRIIIHNILFSIVFIIIILLSMSSPIH